ncbi:MAG: AsnC family transcriptional regulator [gamma proteobacterium symbiont of Lucinoma myriamae]|nr:AsnC family transcriptional regulator [gamma proteobacterium symbiont of Lucinoma myriamae]MCU7819497.1 AsnC family transcriptional regulator [gamma proteobacterium symbiont of Lucinoma myriamae]MCU7832552.1 AsnC family transcriptional regulator [gamma proteobacterium symbiont of Lucinoma myriamae]
MDDIDRQIINSLQGNFPIEDHPYQIIAERLGIKEDELLTRLGILLEDKTLTRFGPMYDIQKLGGSFSLCAIRVPLERFEEVTEIVNSFSEVAHNYERDHEFNMWYVLATESLSQIDITNQAIEKKTGLKVYNMPKLQEFFVGLHFEA